MSEFHLTIGLIIVVGVALVALWLQWQSATPAERETMIGDSIAEMTAILVDAAEQKLKGQGNGQIKFGWVLNRLQRRFSEMDSEVLGDYIEAAVLRLNERKTALRQAQGPGHRNGASDRYA